MFLNQQKLLCVLDFCTKGDTYHISYKITTLNTEYDTHCIKFS